MSDELHSAELTLAAKRRQSDGKPCFAIESVKGGGATIQTVGHFVEEYAKGRQNSKQRWKRIFWEGEKHRISRATTADPETNQPDVETIEGHTTTTFVLRNPKMMRLELSACWTIQDDMTRCKLRASTRHRDLATVHATAGNILHFLR
jgi:hypothetical protein